MKNVKRLVFVLVLVTILSTIIPTFTMAASSALDFAKASDGIFAVSYDDGTARKVKIGVQYESGKMAYSNYTMGDNTNFALDNGSGTYKVTLNVHVSGTSYKVVESKTVKVTMGAAASSTNSKYLKSVSEISFKSDDSVSRKAAELTKGLKSDSEKIVAIYNYLVKNFSYDYDFANKVISGQIKTHTPSPKNTLSSKKGVCYDLSSLMAAMLRSQGIPTKLVKGYSTQVNGYHAWNSVYDESTDSWYTIDITVSICLKTGTVKSLSKATQKSSNYTAKTSV